MSQVSDASDMQLALDQVDYINELTDGCLMEILKYLDLRQLLPLQSVCTRWAWVITEMCQLKESLKIFGSFRSMITYYKLVKRFNAHGDPNCDLDPKEEANDLVIRNSEFTPELAYQLTRLFPNVRKLVFFFYNWPSQVPLSHFLEQLPELTSLSLHKIPPMMEDQKQVWQSLDKAINITRLHLFEVTKIPSNLSLFGRLQHFSLTGCTNNDTVVSVIGALGANCKRLLLDNITCKVEQLQQAIGQNQNLTANLVFLTVGQIFPIKQQPPPQQPRPLHLRLHEWHIQRRGIRNDEIAPPKSMHDIELFHHICGNGYFGSLRYLDVTYLLSESYLKLTLADLLNQFAKLPSLAGLRLPIYAFDISGHLPVLKSIRVLHLELILSAIQTKAFLTTIGTLFPQLRWLTIECYDLNLTDELKTDFAQMKATQFPRLVKHSLREYSDLRHYLPSQGPYRVQYLNKMEDLK